MRGVASKKIGYKNCFRWGLITLTYREAHVFIGLSKANLLFFVDSS